MCDTGAEGTALCAHGVDVDPLVIARCVGEHVDSSLVYLQPVAVAEVLAHGAREVRRTLEDGCHRFAPPSHGVILGDPNDIPSPAPPASSPDLLRCGSSCGKLGDFLLSGMLPVA